MNKISIKNALLSARQTCTTLAVKHGAEVRVVLNFKMGERTPQAVKEARPAELAGIDPMAYAGWLDRVFVALNGDMCFTILTLSRVDAKKGRYCYRTFNVDSGQVASVLVIA